MTLSLLKQYLRVDHDADDALLSHFLTVSQAWVVRYLPEREDGPLVAQAVLQGAAFLYEQRLHENAAAFDQLMESMLRPLLSIRLT